MSNDTKVNGQEFVRSLTGFDEIAIEKAFGAPLNRLGEMSAPRALLFIMNRRDGLNDFESHKKAMEVPRGEIEDIFETEDAEAVVDGQGN